MTEWDEARQVPRRVGIAEVQGTLALELQPREAPPYGLPRSTRWCTATDACDGDHAADGRCRPEERRHAGATARSDTHDTEDAHTDDTDHAAGVVPIDRARRRTHHDLDGWVSRFAQAAVEIVGGDRPVSQLLRWTSADVYAELERRAVLVARAGHHQPGQGRVQPVRPKVLSAHSFFVTPQVVEASVHVRYGARSRALAARFETRQGRWVCTALEWA
ncbi:Rv3235 family protein [Nocardioides sp. BP30]|uniref:Rv3235 family protein n=1 Tax=Nocardioides sp. BP30 TaxID=3036374 RepID=UPI00246860A0|nr:Rv3235 family protein [Nocardioides sp. BP30]WGL54224.1 Rv3235 family protein [Nocardioides sp. BP30]